MLRRRERPMADGPPTGAEDPKPKPRNARIAIVGAGPAGLATAWFLKKQGFTNVTVFERYGRVGGLCYTMNDGYRAFDLGGNYLTRAYRETRKIARAVGARTYRAERYIGLRLPGDTQDTALRYYDMSDVVRETRDERGRPIGKVGWISFAWALIRYVVERWKVRGVIDEPTFGKVHKHPELCVTFGAWLRARGLEKLSSLFEIPITMMGYGFLDEIAAPYALKYMSLRTFIPMCLRQVWFVGWLFPWPRRFKLGFQRMWDAVGWRLNVRQDVAIGDIWRFGDQKPPKGEAPSERHPIRIDVTYPSRVFQHDERVEFTRWFDHLIVASSRVGPLTAAFHVEPDGEEHRLFKKVDTFGFCMTTMHPESAEKAKPFRLQERVVCVLPFRHDVTLGRPWVVVQLWPDDTQMLQCYSRLEKPNDTKNRRKEVIDGAERLVELLGGKRAGSADPHLCRWEHYEQWPYFGHVSPKDIEAGFFRDLEKLQGRRNTCWVGGFTNFELIEPIVCYAKALVERHFVPAGEAPVPAVRPPAPPTRDAIVFRRDGVEPAPGDAERPERVGDPPPG